MPLFGYKESFIWKIKKNMPPQKSPTKAKNKCEYMSNQARLSKIKRERRTIRGFEWSETFIHIENEGFQDYGHEFNQFKVRSFETKITLQLDLKKRKP